MNCQETIGRPKNLEALLSPRQIAVVGVSAADPQSWGHRVVRVLLDGGYDGAVSIVHPKTDFPGVNTVRQISDLTAPELVVICVPAQRAIDVVRQSRAAGAKAVIVFASEFAEVGGAGEKLQEELVEAAGDMLMLGPNCFGISNRVDNVKLSAAPFLNNPLNPPGTVALVAQSGALGLVLSRCVEEAGSGYSHFVSVGNEATLGATDVALQLVERDEVGVVLLYLEAVRDPATLAQTATRAAELGKRVVLLSAGSSEAGQRAALSHTAAIAGNDLFLDALCDDFGIVRIRDDEEVKPVLAALERGWAMPKSPRVCVLSNSGGAGAVLADRVEAEGGRVTPLAPETRAKVAEIGMIGAGDSNPIDIGGGWEAVLDRFKPTLDVLAAADEVDALVVYIAFGEMCVDKVVPLARMCSDCAKPVTFIWQIAPQEGLDQIETPGILAQSMGEGARMLAAQMKLRPGRNARWQPVKRHAITLPKLAAGQKTLAEHESSALLAAHGLTFAPSVFGKVDDLAGIAAQVAKNGWERLVVKGNASDVPHRNRVGLVRVGVTQADLPDVLAQMGETLNTHSSDANRGLLVMPMIAFDEEIGVGGLVDPVYGPVLLIGPGGVGIETAVGRRDALLLSTDSTTWDAYAARIEARYHLNPGVIRPVIVAAATLLGSGEVSEIDINPMVRTPEGGLIALDALVVVSGT
ncbi:acetate--CoA ligase family protein [Phaeovulum sp.]|uniref:acetate--CoA ligase family protein n=1 Tax=Phaeovulum sp. TaxID=2934796 RepID=UPI0039E563B4